MLFAAIGVVVTSMSCLGGILVLCEAMQDIEPLRSRNAIGRGHGGGRQSGRSELQVKDVFRQHLSWPSCESTAGHAACFQKTSLIRRSPIKEHVKVALGGKPQSGLHNG